MSDDFTTTQETKNQTSNAVANEESSDHISEASIPAANYNVTTGEDVNSTSNKGEGGVKMPFGLGRYTKAKDIMKAFGELRTNAGFAIKVVEETDDISADYDILKKISDEMLVSTAEIWSKYKGDEEVEQDDLEKLAELSSKFEGAYAENHEAIINHGKKQYGQFSNNEKINSNSKEIKAAMQQAYYSSDSSTAEKIGKLIDTIDEYNGKLGEVSGFAQDIVSDLNNSVLIKQLDKYSGKLGKMTTSAKDALECADHLNTLYDSVGNAGGDLGGQAKNLESLMYLVDQSINLVDLPGLNLIQGIWNNVYKPMIDVCVKGIGRIEDILGEFGREFVEKVAIGHWEDDAGGKDNVAPTEYRNLINRYYEGGWELFNFMWNVMCSEWDRIPNDEVVEYFEKNYDRINAGAGQEKEIPYEGIGPFWHIDSTSLMFWALGSKRKLWAMFYGNVPYPPKTKFTDS